MSGQDDRHWRQVQREREAPAGRQERAEADPALLHPANEGHDQEQDDQSTREEHEDLATLFGAARRRYDRTPQGA